MFQIIVAPERRRCLYLRPYYSEEYIAAEPIRSASTVTYGTHAAWRRWMRLNLIDVNKSFCAWFVHRWALYPVHTTKIHTFRYSWTKYSERVVVRISLDRRRKMDGFCCRASCHMHVHSMGRELDNKVCAVGEYTAVISVKHPDIER